MEQRQKSAPPPAGGSDILGSKSPKLKNIDVSSIVDEIDTTLRRDAQERERIRERERERQSEGQCGC